MANVRKMAVAGFASLLMSATAKPVLAADVTPLRMVCSTAHEWCEMLARRYEERFRVPVDMVQMATNAALEEIRNPRGAARFDVWFGGTGDPHLEAAAENLTVAYRSPHLKDLHDWAARQATISGNRTVGVYAGMLGFIVNEEKLKERNITVPRCWFNLLRKEYSGLVLAPNPASSGTGYTMVATLVSMMGEEMAFDYMKRVSPSVKEYVASGSQLAAKVVAGDAPIAIGFIHDGVRERMKGTPISVVSPCEGAGYETGSVSIVRGGSQNEARRFVDWVLSAEVQSYAVEAKQYQLPSNQKTPIPKGAPRFSDFKIYMAYDPKKFASPEEKRRLTARWEREVPGVAAK